MTLSLTPHSSPFPPHCNLPRPVLAAIMMSTSVVGLALLAVHASAQSLPTITADGQNLAINTMGGDVQVRAVTPHNPQGTRTV